MDEVQGRMVEKTIIHLTDDKGWEKIEEVPINYLSKKFRVYKKNKTREKCNLYEFQWVRTVIERVDNLFVKHMWFEMK